MPNFTMQLNSGKEETGRKSTVLLKTTSWTRIHHKTVLWKETVTTLSAGCVFPITKFIFPRSKLKDRQKSTQNAFRRDVLNTSMKTTMLRYYGSQGNTELPWKPQKYNSTQEPLHRKKNKKQNMSRDRTHPCKRRDTNQ